ncbi:MAG: hypothetical protein WC943_15340, partial [Elusimicrobiota bacterium]
MTPGPKRARLLFLEFLSHPDDRRETSMFFPFFKGAAGQGGVPARWLYFMCEPSIAWGRTTGRLFRADLGDEDLGALRSVLERFRPTHVVSNEILGPKVRRELRASALRRFMVLPCEFDMEAFVWGEHDPAMDPYLRLVRGSGKGRESLHQAGWFLRWLGAKRHPRGRDPILDVVEPDYEASAVGKAAQSAEGPPVVVLGGRSCMGRPSPARNPFFRGLKDPRSLPSGCSFCGGSIDHGPLGGHAAGSLELAERQLRASAAADPRSSRSRGSYIVYDLGLFRCMDRFFAMVLSSRMPPSRFVFCPRIDDLLASAGL